MNRIAFAIVILSVGLHDTTARAADPFNGDFYQLADVAGNFDYELVLRPAGFAFPSTAQWIGPAGVQLGLGRMPSVRRDTFEQLAADVFGTWTLKYTPTFPPVPPPAPVEVQFTIAPFDLTRVHTSLAAIISPTPGSTIPLDPVAGGVIDFTWIYEDGRPQSGRSASISRSGLEMDGELLGGYPEVYRVVTQFEAGRSSGIATVRAGRFNSNPTTITGDAKFLELFEPQTTWRNFSAPAQYTFVAIPEPSAGAMAIAAMGVGILIRLGRARLV
jgi:hypothetical protein